VDHEISRSTAEDDFGGRNYADVNFGKRTEIQTVVFIWGYVVPPCPFWGEKSVSPNHFLMPLKFGKV
jgi:hypothetical protein